MTKNTKTTASSDLRFSLTTERMSIVLMVVGLTGSFLAGRAWITSTESDTQSYVLGMFILALYGLYLAYVGFNNVYKTYRFARLGRRAEKGSTIYGVGNLWR